MRINNRQTNMNYAVLTTLILALLGGCQVAPPIVTGEIDVEIWQKGVQLLPVRGIYKLKKEEFDLKIVFTDQFRTLVNAYSTDESYIQANNGLPLDKIIGFSTTGMAEGIFNDKLNVTLSRDSPNSWYYESQGSNRCNKTEKRGDKIICTRTIKNITYHRAKTVSIEEYQGSDLFFVFINSEYDRNKASNIELYRQSLHLRYEAEETGKLSREVQAQMFLQLWTQTCAKYFTKPDEIRVVAKKYRFEENPPYAKNYLKDEKGTVWDVSLGPHTQQTLVMLENGASCRVYARRAASQPINMVFEKVMQGINKPGVAVEKIVDKELELDGVKLKQIAYYLSRIDMAQGWVFIATTSDSETAGIQATITVNRGLKPELNGDGVLK